MRGPCFTSAIVISLCGFVVCENGLCRRRQLPSERKRFKKSRRYDQEALQEIEECHYGVVNADLADVVRHAGIERRENLILL